jgi:hypothetical protein
MADLHALTRVGMIVVGVITVGDSVFSTWGSDGYHGRSNRTELSSFGAILAVEGTP